LAVASSSINPTALGLTSHFSIAASPEHNVNMPAATSQPPVKLSLPLVSPFMRHPSQPETAALPPIKD
jgi:hypothetical protein